MLIRNPQARSDSATEQAVPDETLVQLLHESGVDQCIHALGQFSDLPVSARVAAIQRLRRESDTRLQQVILNHLVPDLAPDEVPELLELLSSEQASLRNQVIDAMAQVGGGRALEVLMMEIRRLLRAEDPDVRILSLNLVAALERSALLPDVAVVLKEDQNINVCMTALDALVVLGSAEEWPLAKALNDRFPDDPFVQFGVDQARRALLGDG